MLQKRSKCHNGPTYNLSIYEFRKNVLTIEHDLLHCTVKGKYNVYKIYINIALLKNECITYISEGEH